MAKLSEKQLKFCEVYAANGGNATAASRDAGYKQPNVQGAQNLAKLGIQEYIKELTEKIKSARVATARERQEFWTEVMRGKAETFTDDDGNVICGTKMADRIKASELLGKSQMDFIEVVKIDGVISIKDMSDDELKARTSELRKKRKCF